ncbi:uncharacterized protein Z520_04908 [Fonsecaea multimorphosa CBS 102226]|uniref:Uncharacterized protein n=1 Tax=Fonsecaea multimorphosa CBS 102226 TaxID=1442371 RepID=A0A0D2K0J0_9EURO|nr:uncharacterized protein Z520_04908 [Fonsecaea multimorphosa CBS 102226]KIX99332.1 hypothetical protein Z520_04908 [Fonsecaea multimorphosa CBS 102226]
MACGTFRACDQDPCGLPVKKSFFDEPACDYWEHGGDSMVPTRKRALRGTTVTVINGMKGWGGLNQTGYSYDEIPGVTIHSSNDIEDAEGFSSFGEGTLRVTIPGDKLPDRIGITNAGEAPICIAGVHLTAPDGSQITMTGNLGRLCGADHYESASEVLPNAEGKPAACVWVDRHGSNGIRLPGIAFDLQNYDSEDGPGPEFYNITSVQDLCKAPFIALGDDQPALSRRQLVMPNVARDDSSVASLNFDSALVKSNLDLSSAVQMCRGEFTKGPHFVSLSEGLYCDMSTRQLYPVCKDDAGHDGETCFDVEQNELVERDSGEDDPASRTRLVERYPESQNAGRVKVLKTFRYVDTWH